MSKIMKVESPLSPLRGEEVMKKAYKSFFIGNAGTPEALLRAHVKASLNAFPERAEEFLSFFKRELETLMEREMTLMSQNAVYFMGRKASAMNPEPKTNH